MAEVVAAGRQALTKNLQFYLGTSIALFALILGQEHVIAGVEDERRASHGVCCRNSNPGD
jgi:hypothetical protein